MSWWPFHISKWHPYIHHPIFKLLQVCKSHPLFSLLICKSGAGPLIECNEECNEDFSVCEMGLTARRWCLKWSALTPRQHHSYQHRFSHPNSRVHHHSHPRQCSWQFSWKQVSVFETEGSLTSCFRLGAWLRNIKICHIPKFGATQGMVRLQSSPCVLRHSQKH